MQESVIYQDIKAEGLQEGRQQGEANLVLRQLSRKLGNLSPQVQNAVRQLDTERIEELGDALLDFAAMSDLTDWLSL